MSRHAAEVHRIFLLALPTSGPERQRLLQAECGGDDALQREVEALLGSDQSTGFLDETGLAAVRQALGDDPAELPERIGAFTITGVLGRGGMGIVYRARQDQPARDVALKVLAPGAGSREARHRFALEAELLGRLQHPGIAQIHAAGSYATPHGERPFLAMELVEGVPLHEWANRRPGPDIAERVRLWAEICDAVHHAHQKGVLHRDLKPGNVLVTGDGRAKVLDFGIARLIDDVDHTQRTQQGQLLGTLAYMSPEQANGAFDRLDVRSDVYGLGAIGYELLAGAPPIAIAGQPLTEALRRIVDAEPAPLGDHDSALRGDLQTITRMALHKEPERRYPSADALAADLRRYLAHEPIAARPPTTGYVLRRFARRHRGLFAGVSIALLAVLGGAALAIGWALRAERAERTAQAQTAIAREEARVANRVTELFRKLFVGANPEFGTGRDVTAKEIVAAGRATVEREVAADPFAGARVSLLLGEISISLGDLTTGEQCIAAGAAALRERISGDDDRLVEAMHMQAWAWQRQQRWADSGQLYEAALAMHRRLGRDSAVTTAKCLEGMAVAAARTGRGDDARRWFAAALPLREREGDPLRLALHWQQVASMSLLGKDHEAADAAFAKAAELLPAGNDAMAAMIAGNRGNLRLRQNRLDDAEVEFRKALAAAERAYGADSPRLVVSLAHVGTLCAQSGRSEEGEQLLLRAVALGGDERTSKDPALANALSNLGRLAATTDRLAAAVDWWQRAEAIDARLRPGSAGHRALLADLAEAKERLGDADGAAELRRKASALPPR